MADKPWSGQVDSVDFKLTDELLLLRTGTNPLAKGSYLVLLFNDNLDGAKVKTAYQVEAKAFTDALFDKLTLIEANATNIANSSTSDLAEGTNLYFTDPRADARITLQKGAANGLATLGADSKIPNSQLPALAITETFVVANEAAQLALVTQEGDVAVRTDLNESFIKNSGTTGTITDWTKLLTPTDAVLSVNGFAGAVVLTTTDIAEGTNLYFTNSRFDTQFGTKDTDDLIEGATNLYFSAAEQSKLGGIEDNADVTDAANVAAAGAALLGNANEYTATQNFNATVLTDAANISWDASANQVASVTLAGNRTLDNPTNLVDGATYILTIKQDAVGSRTLVYGTAYKFSGGIAPTLSAGINDVDIITFISDGTSMFGVFQGDFS